MTKKLCAHCGESNPLTNHFCGRCGAPFDTYPLVPARPQPLATWDRPLLPAPQLRQIGQTVAVGLLALAAEAGLNWLRHRLQQRQLLDPPAQTGRELMPLSHHTPQEITIAAVWHEEVVETTWTQKGWVRRTFARTFWRRRS